MIEGQIALRSGSLKQIHIGHQGVHKCQESMEQSVWWTEILKELKELVNNCIECHKMQAQRSQSFIPSTLQKNYLGKRLEQTFLIMTHEWRKSTYHLIVDYYSRFIEIVKLSRPTAENLLAIPRIYLLDMEYQRLLYRIMDHSLLLTVCIRLSV